MRWIATLGSILLVVMSITRLGAIAERERPTMRKAFRRNVATCLDHD